jgi:hypothetical protein
MKYRLRDDLIAVKEKDDSILLSPPAPHDTPDNRYWVPRTLLSEGRNDSWLRGRQITNKRRPYKCPVCQGEGQQQFGAQCRPCPACKGACVLWG